MEKKQNFRCRYCNIEITDIIMAERHVCNGIKANWDKPVYNPKSNFINKWGEIIK